MRSDARGMPLANRLFRVTDECGTGRCRAVDARNFSDEEIVERVCAGDTEFFEILLRRYNQRVFRTARSVLRDDAEAEEAAQEAWVRAFDRLDQFAGRGRFASWVTR